MIVDDGYNIGRDYLVEKAVEGGRWKVRPVSIPICLVMLWSNSPSLLVFDIVRGCGGKQMWNGGRVC